MDVYNGESVMVEWLIGVQTAVETGFTRSNGARAVHICSDFITMSRQLGWSIYPLTPGWEEMFMRWLQIFEVKGVFFL